MLAEFEVTCLSLGLIYGNSTTRRLFFVYHLSFLFGMYALYIFDINIHIFNINIHIYVQSDLPPVLAWLQPYAIVAWLSNVLLVLLLL